MKNILCGAVAALALVAFAAPAAAQTNTLHYTNPAYNLNNPGPVAAFFLGEVPLAFNIGTRYRAQADAPSDTETATPVLDVLFTLKGSVNKDCSFYSGNNTAARTIDFGNIGVRTGNNENVTNAFEMVGPAVANVDTLTAGCNFNNSVEISKNDIRGLVNTAPGGYDTNEFQANIPYSVAASWTGVALNAQVAGSPQGFTVGTAANAGAVQQGAWRSRMDIDFVAPVVTGKGLVAGDYSGTTTLTLRAL